MLFIKRFINNILLNSQIQVCRHSVFQAPTGSIAEMAESTPKRAYTRIGLYKGNIVAIKQIRKKSVDLTRSIRKELKQVIVYYKSIVVENFLI